VGFPGAIERARALMRETSMPASLEQYVARKTEAIRIDVAGEEWERFFRQVGESVGGEAPIADSKRAAGGFVFYGTDEPPLTAVPDRIRQIYGSRQSLVSYLALGPEGSRRYLEVWYETQPRDLQQSPRSLLYPKRRQSWWFLAGGLLLYALIPWPGRGDNTIGYDRVGGVLGLDFLGVVAASLFFGIPLYAADSASAVFGEGLGLTVFLWLVALGGVGLVVWAARNAAFRLTLLPGGLRLSRIFGSRDYSLADLANLSYLKADGARTGLLLEWRDSSALRLKWDELLHFERLLEHLKGAGFAIQEFRNSSVPGAGKQP